MRRFVRRALLRGITASIVLPMVIAVAVGTGALLGSLQDRAGSVVCLRVGLFAAMAWLLAVVTTAVLGGIAALGGEPSGRRRGRRGCDGRSRRRPPHRRGRRPSWDGHRRRRRHGGRSDGGAGTGEQGQG